MASFNEVLKLHEANVLNHWFNLNLFSDESKDKRRQTPFDEEEQRAILRLLLNDIKEGAVTSDALDRVIEENKCLKGRSHAQIRSFIQYRRRTQMFDVITPKTKNRNRKRLLGAPPVPTVPHHNQKHWDISSQRAILEGNFGKKVRENHTITKEDIDNLIDDNEALQGRSHAHIRAFVQHRRRTENFAVIKPGTRTRQPAAPVGHKFYNFEEDCKTSSYF